MRLSAQQLLVTVFGFCHQPNERSVRVLLPEKQENFFGAWRDLLRSEADPEGPLSTALAPWTGFSKTLAESRHSSGNVMLFCIPTVPPAARQSSEQGPLRSQCAGTCYVCQMGSKLGPLSGVMHNIEQLSTVDSCRWTFVVLPSKEVRGSI